jgi:uncharacterized protein YndB with AHSA1/START domain
MTLECKATTIKTTFSRETSVEITIRASPSIVWNLLTTAEDYTRWNSTVISVTGEIKLGKTIRLVSKLDPKREFRLTVKEFDPEKRMAWGDGKGIRVYTLADDDDGTLRFSIIERIGGLMFPLYAKYIPPFDESFERFATDLKNEAEIKHPQSA